MAANSNNALYKFSQLIAKYEKHINHKKIHLDIGCEESKIFHVHPQCIANNYLYERNEFKQQVFEIADSLTKSQFQPFIDNPKSQFVLNHFGFGGFAIIKTQEVVFEAKTKGSMQNDVVNETPTPSGIYNGHAIEYIFDNKVVEKIQLDETKSTVVYFCHFRNNNVLVSVQ
eukprot:323062_1